MIRKRAIYYRINVGDYSRIRVYTGNIQERSKGGDFMEFIVCDYEVVRIDGDYAHLRRMDQPHEDLKLVARALLPQEIMEGSKLHYEMLQYQLVQ